MARLIAAFLAGLLFGVGLGLSQMVNPAKVLAFLDVAGDWDPSLALVMLGAVLVTFVAFRPILRLPQPVFAGKFSLPTLKSLTARLILGSAIFGVGWGLVGFCPGPAIASLAYGLPETLVFLAALIAGSWLAKLVPAATVKQSA
ncbi:MAG: YeeE/YedE family protein [Alphaproteobacteria bacterium]|nr:YeeE/YedE family protein [Alphaproteobacteria bacterium]